MSIFTYLFGTAGQEFYISWHPHEQTCFRCFYIFYKLCLHVLGFRGLWKWLTVYAFVVLKAVSMHFLSCVMLFFPVSLFVTGLKLRGCSECTLSRWQMSVFRASSLVEAGDGPCEDALRCSQMFGLWRFSQEQLCQQPLGWWKTDALAWPSNCLIFGHLEIIDISEDQGLRARLPVAPPKSYMLTVYTSSPCASCTYQNFLKLFFCS